jgi:hypothetical protein
MALYSHSVANYLPLPSLAHSLAHVRADLDILEDDLLFSPRMREYCVGRDIATGRFAKDDLAVGFALQEAYKRHGWRFASDLMASVTRYHLFGILAQALRFKGRQNAKQTSKD